MNVFELLLKIEQNRRLYIGDGDIVSLGHFVGGYCFCCQMLGVDYKEKDFYEFTHYVYSIFGETKSISLFRCILENTSTNEEAFQTFFGVLHDFLELR